MHRQVLAFIPALAWIFVQLSMSLAVASVPANADGTVSRAQLADLLEAGITQTVICTPTGLAVIDLTDGIPPEGPVTADSGCQWCQGFGNHTLPSAPDSVIRISLEPGAAEYSVSENRVPACKRARLGFSSRAPPL